MSSNPMSLSATPPVPPDTSAQMGAGPEGTPYAGVGKMLQEQNGDDDQKGFSDIEKAHPQGALIVKVNAVKKVLEEIAQMGKSMGSYARQASDLLQQGLAAELKGAQPGMVGGPSGSAGTGQPDVQSPDRDLNKGFVG
jgi:hypothetical protein